MKKIFVAFNKDLVSRNTWYEAYLEGHPGKSGTGNSPEQAIGTLVMLCPELFQIKIQSIS